MSTNLKPTAESIDYIDSGFKYTDKANAIIKHVGNLGIYGPTGAGKTKFVHTLAKMGGFELFEFSLRATTTEWDLIAQEVLKGGESATREGIVLKWLNCSKKAMLYLDEFNFASSGVTGFTHSLTDFRGDIWVPQLERTFKRDANKVFVVSYNPYEKSGYAGTNADNIATMRRFERIYIDYMPLSDEIDLLKRFYAKDDFCRKWAKLAAKTRVLHKLGKLRTPLTTGNLINYANMRQDLTDDDLIEIASNMFPEAEKALFLRLTQGTEDATIKQILTNSGIV